MRENPKNERVRIIYVQKIKPKKEKKRKKKKKKERNPSTSQSEEGSGFQQLSFLCTLSCLSVNFHHQSFGDLLGEPTLKHHQDDVVEAAEQPAALLL